MTSQSTQMDNPVAVATATDPGLDTGTGWDANLADVTFGTAENAIRIGFQVADALEEDRDDQLRLQQEQAQRQQQNTSTDLETDQQIVQEQRQEEDGAAPDPFEIQAREEIQNFRQEMGTATGRAALGERIAEYQAHLREDGLNGREIDMAAEAAAQEAELNHSAPERREGAEIIEELDLEANDDFIQFETGVTDGKVSSHEDLATLQPGDEVELAAGTQLYVDGGEQEISGGRLVGTFRAVEGTTAIVQVDGSLAISEDSQIAVDGFLVSDRGATMLRTWEGYRTTAQAGEFQGVRLDRMRSRDDLINAAA